MRKFAEGWIWGKKSNGVKWAFQILNTVLQGLTMSMAEAENTIPTTFSA